MNGPRPLDFGRVAMRGGAVTMASQVLRMAIQFVSVVVLARLLVPEDFGLVAAVGPVAAFISLLQDFGFQQAVVQKQKLTERQLNQIFWVSALVGLCSAIVAIAGAPLVASFYADPRMSWIMVASAYPLLLGSLLAVPLALLSRQLRFVQLAINDTAAAFSGLLAAVCAAKLGAGYWSLVIAPAVSVTVALVVVWFASGWKPSQPDFRVHADIVKFGANLTGFNVVNFLARNLDNILIGKFAGAVQLGYYDRAYKLLLFPLQNINAPLGRVMVPLLSLMQDDKERFRDIYIRVNWLLATFIVPGIAAMTMTSTETVQLLFGYHWSGVAPIIAWLGVAGLIQPVSNTTGWIFICQGRTDIMFRWGVYSSIAAVLSFVVGMQWGAVGLAAAYAVQGYALNLPVLAAVIHRVGPVTAADFICLQSLPLGSALVSWGLYNYLAAVAGGSNWAPIVLALGLNYGVALAVMSIVPSSRRALASILNAALRNFRR